MTSALIARTVALPIALGVSALCHACHHDSLSLLQAIGYSVTVPKGILGTQNPVPERNGTVPPSRRTWAKHTNRSRLISQRRRRRRSSGNA